MECKQQQDPKDSVSLLARSAHLQVSTQRHLDTWQRTHRILLHHAASITDTILQATGTTSLPRILRHQDLIPGNVLLPSATVEATPTLLTRTTLSLEYLVTQHRAQRLIHPGYNLLRHRHTQNVSPPLHHNLLTPCSLPPPGNTRLDPSLLPRIASSARCLPIIRAATECKIRRLPAAVPLKVAWLLHRSSTSFLTYSSSKLLGGRHIR